MDIALIVAAVIMLIMGYFFVQIGFSNWRSDREDKYRDEY
jgi:hypothetical protein